MNEVKLSGKITSDIVSNKQDGLIHASCFLLMPKIRGRKRSYIRLRFINDNAKKLIEEFQKGDYIEIEGALSIYERIVPTKKVINSAGEEEELISKVTEIQIKNFTKLYPAEK